jgi:hypothetical protein
MMVLDKLHSHEVHDGLIGFRVQSVDGQKVQFSMTPHLAGMMVAAIQAAAKSLPEYEGPAIPPMGVQPVIGPDSVPGLLLNMGGNLTIAISLPAGKLAELKEAISHLEAHSKAH